MAPNHTKQSLLPIGTFIKNPKKDTVVKHKLLAIGCDMPLNKRKKSKVDKVEQKRRAEEKELKEGAAGWLAYFIRNNSEDPTGYNTELMYQMHGNAPTDDAMGETQIPFNANQFLFSSSSDDDDTSTRSD